MPEQGDDGSNRGRLYGRRIAMNGRGKFDKYTELWRDIERAREDIYFA